MAAPSHGQTASELQRHYMQPATSPMAAPAPVAYTAPANNVAVQYAPPPAPTAYSTQAWAPAAAPSGATTSDNGIRTAVNGDGNQFYYGNVDDAVEHNRDPRTITAKKAYGNGTQVEGSLGYRATTLDWNIAGNNAGQNPNVLSELQWDTTMAEARAGVRHTVSSGMLRQGRFELSGYYAHALSGDVQDSDYLGDNRTQEFSRSNNNAEGSNAYGLKAAVGYEIPFVDRKGARFVMTPLIGADFNSQKMKSTDGNQTFCDTTIIPGCALGSFNGLNSHYKANWYGGFVGMEAEAEYGSHRLRARGEYEGVMYDAEARWNLRPDFAQDPSFEHEATGTGITLGVDYAYALTPSTRLTANAEWTDFTADNDGTDTTFFSDGTSGTTRLNEANWSSQSYRAGVEQKF